MLTLVIPGSCGIRSFCRWLEESGLSSFVASSYGTWQKISKQQEYYFQSYLLPAAYLKRLAKNERSKEKKLLLEKSEELETIGLKIFSDNINEILFAEKMPPIFFKDLVLLLKEETVVYR